MSPDLQGSNDSQSGGGGSTEASADDLASTGSDDGGSRGRSASGSVSSRARSNAGDGARGTGSVGGRSCGRNDSRAAVAGDRDDANTGGGASRVGGETDLGHNGGHGGGDRGADRGVGRASRVGAGNHSGSLNDNGGGGSGLDSSLCWMHVSFRFAKKKKTIISLKQRKTYSSSQVRSDSSASHNSRVAASIVTAKTLEVLDSFGDGLVRVTVGVETLVDVGNEGAVRAVARRVRVVHAADDVVPGGDTGGHNAGVGQSLRGRRRRSQGRGGAADHGDAGRA